SYDAITVAVCMLRVHVSIADERCCPVAGQLSLPDVGSISTCGAARAHIQSDCQSIAIINELVEVGITSPNGIQAGYTYEYRVSIRSATVLSHAQPVFTSNGPSYVCNERILKCAAETRTSPAERRSSGCCRSSQEQCVTYANRICSRSYRLSR